MADTLTWYVVKGDKSWKVQILILHKKIDFLNKEFSIEKCGLEKVCWKCYHYWIYFSKQIRLENYLNSVKIRFWRYEDGDGRNLGWLGHSVSINKLLVSVVRNLVVDRHQVDRRTPRKRHRVRRHFRGAKIEGNFTRLHLLDDPLRQPAEAVVRSSGHCDGVRSVFLEID